MRKKTPDGGQIRHIKRFAILPISCTDGEWVWLETVVIEQRYFDNPFHHGWVNIRIIHSEHES